MKFQLTSGWEPLLQRSTNNNKLFEKIVFCQRNGNGILVTTKLTEKGKKGEEREG